MTMSDRIAVMNAGRIEQLDTPERIYRAPRTRFVAHFVGKVNFIHGRVMQADASYAALDTTAGVLRCVGAPDGVGTQVTVAIRPEHMTIRPAHAHADDLNVIRGRITAQTFCGNVRHYAVQVPDHDMLLVETRAGDAGWTVGDEVGVTWHPDNGVIVAESVQ